MTGSYTIPITIGDPDSYLFVSEDIERAWKTFSELLSGTGEEQADLLYHALPDSALRKRVLEYIKGMAPSAGQLFWMKRIRPKKFTLCPGCAIWN
jgi:hypothetical protein